MSNENLLIICSAIFIAQCVPELAAAVIGALSFCLLFFGDLDHFVPIQTNGRLGNNPTIWYWLTILYNGVITES